MATLTSPSLSSRMSSPLLTHSISSNSLQHLPLAQDWSLNSWRSKPIKQQPLYENQNELHESISYLKQLPPLVHPIEILSLRSQLAEVSKGKRFILQGGDCSERFLDCSQLPIESKLKILLQMSLVLIWGARVPVVRIGRLAGQYGKPRSSPIEKLMNGNTIPSFRGDNVNCFDPTPEARRNDPRKLIEGHFHSAATLNYLRALIRGGFADLHLASNWQMEGIRSPQRLKEYQRISEAITDALHFLEVAGVLPTRGNNSVDTIDFFTSHEALILEYESACTRGVQLQSAPSSDKIDTVHLENGLEDRSDEKPQFFNTSAHFLWIGNRTRGLEDAHIEYVRGLANPIGIKVDSELEPEELVKLLEKVDPHKEPGKVTLISRFGCENVKKVLPKFIRAVQMNGRAECTIWSCDPMHGNTISTSSGLKTRKFDDILSELTLTFECHMANGSRLGGVHFELTGESVTECIGGGQDLQIDDLPLNYSTQCDPRLNYLQSMEMSYALAEMMRDAKIKIKISHSLEKTKAIAEEKT